MSSQELIQFHVDKVLSLTEPQMYSLGSALEYQASMRPEHPAIIFSDRVYNYDEFNQEANRYANFFAEQGFVKDDVVALIMSNRPEFIFILTGLSKLGVSVALINYELRGAVLAQGVNIVNAKAIIVCSEMIELYNSIAGIIRLYSPRRVFAVSEQQPVNLTNKMEWLNPLLETMSTENPASTGTISSEDILAFIYTSGNYGPRKAVPIQHKRVLLVGHQAGLFCHMNDERRQYMCLPLYLNVGLNMCLASMLASGSTMVLKEKFSSGVFWQDINKYHVDYFVGIVELFRYIYSLPPQNHDAENTLKVAICNGITHSLQEPFRERFDIDHMIEIYGTSENIGFFINYLEHPGICGNLNLGGVRQGEVVQCDQDSGNVYRDQNGWVMRCQAGEKGVLLCAVNEYNTFTGYVGDPEATQLKQVRNAFKPGDCYLNTFDMVKLHEDDEISFVNRLGNAYRWKGKTVSTTQVADVIMHFMGPIDDVCVYSVTIPGHEGRCGMAAIKLLPDEKLQWKSFVEYINRKMPSHARPVFIRLVPDVPQNIKLEDMKSEYKKEAYTPGIVNDPLYCYDNRSGSYQPLTISSYNTIMDRGYYYDDSENTGEGEV